MRTAKALILITAALLCASTAWAIGLDPALDNENPLAPFAALLGGALVTKLCLYMGACRIVAKLISTKLQELLDAAVQFVRGTKDESDDHWLNSILSSRVYRLGQFAVDYFFSIKLPVLEAGDRLAEDGSRKPEAGDRPPSTVHRLPSTALLLACALPAALLLTGCGSAPKQVYKTSAITHAAVVGAMHGWNDYLGTQYPTATPERRAELIRQERTVADGYGKYQAAQSLVLSAAQALLATGDAPAQDRLTTATTDAAQAAADLFGLLSQFNVINPQHAP